AWVGNVSAGLAHAYRRAMEQGVPRPIEVRDHSNFSIAQALLAGALGAPYLPTRSLLGSDIPRANGTFREASDPFSGDALLLIPAITPDVTAIAVQRADEDGNAHLWGPWCVSQEAALAAPAGARCATMACLRRSPCSDAGARAHGGDLDVGLRLDAARFPLDRPPRCPGVVLPRRMGGLARRRTSAVDGRRDRARPRRDQALLRRVRSSGPLVRRA